MRLKRIVNRFGRLNTSISRIINGFRKRRNFLTHYSQAVGGIECQNPREVTILDGSRQKVNIAVLSNAAKTKTLGIHDRCLHRFSNNRSGSRRNRTGTISANQYNILSAMLIIGDKRDQCQQVMKALDKQRVVVAIGISRNLTGGRRGQSLGCKRLSIGQKFTLVIEICAKH